MDGTQAFKKIAVGIHKTGDIRIGRYWLRNLGGLGKTRYEMP